MTVEVFERKRLELGEKIAAKPRGTALGQLYHDGGLRIRAYRAEKVNAKHGKQRSGELRNFFCGRQIADEFVEHRAQEVRSGNA